MKSHFLVLFLILVPCQAGFAQKQPTKVPSNGSTNVSATLNGKEVKALVRTLVAPNSVSGSPAQSFVQCTSSRIPCSLTAQIKLFEGSNEVFVPRVAYADLGDISNVELTMDNGLFVLTIKGGDASEAYIAKLEFNKERVVKRLLYSAEDPARPLEVSQFFMVTSDN